MPLDEENFRDDDVQCRECKQWIPKEYAWLSKTSDTYCDACWADIGADRDDDG